MSGGLAGAMVAGALASALMAGPAHAESRVSADRVTLRTVTGLPKVVDETRVTEAWPLASGGDQDGDGRDDPLVGSPQSRPLGRSEAGSAFVALRGNRVDVGNLTGLGYRLDGAPPALPVELDDGVVTGERAGAAVAGVGDVNGDGLDDLAVGAPRSSAGGVALAGAVWVAFGRRPAGATDLGAFAGRGFRIDGAAASALAGSHVAAAGDTNGDGLDDIVVGDVGRAWIVPGQRGTSPVRLGAPGGPGWTISPPSGPYQNQDVQPESVVPATGVGDVNGDGLDDLAVGVPDLEPRRRYQAGAVYVVPGAREPGRDLDLGRPGRGVFRIVGENDSGRIGEVVAPAGDVDGDGLGDLLIGAPDLGGDTSDETDDHGAAYLVRGRRRPRAVDLGKPRTYGLRITGDEGDFDAETGSGLAGIGDTDGDGSGEIAVAAPGTDGQCVRDTGAIYVLDRGRSTGTIDLRSAPRGVVRIDGARRGARLGQTLAPLGGFQPRGAALLAGSQPRGDQGGARPDPPRVLRTSPLPGLRRAVRPDDCFSLRLGETRATRIARTGSVRVGVIARAAPDGAPVQAGLALAARGGVVIAYGTGVMRKRRATVRLRVSRRGRRLLRRGGGQRAFVFGSVALSDDARAATSVGLRLRP